MNFENGWMKMWIKEITTEQNWNFDNYDATTTKEKLQKIYLKFNSPFFLMKKRRQTVFIQSQQNSSDSECTWNGCNYWKLFLTKISHCHWKKWRTKCNWILLSFCVVVLPLLFSLLLVLYGKWCLCLYKCGEPLNFWVLGCCV